MGMKGQAVIPAAMLCIVLAGCDGTHSEEPRVPPDPPSRVTLDIQAGIEKHIREKTRRDGGTYKREYEGEELHLKLVRVHTEYLANLGPGSHFACIDMASADGDVYDIDFFLSGEPGAMTVTETTFHKVNGKPLYVWKQKRDKTWVRRPAKNAKPELLGAIKGRDQFTFFYKVTLPGISDPARMWLPLPQSDDFQTVKVESIDVPGPSEILEESQYGNRVLYLTPGPEDSGKTLELQFSVERLEKNVYAAPPPENGAYLNPATRIPANEQFRTIAEGVVAGKDGNLVRARALYDHTINRMRYAKYGDGWGQGDAVYACDARHGNCTDFHSYFIALARAVDIPARFAIGAAIPSMRDDGGVDGYHCWAEFYTDGHWWPIDVSEGDKCSPLSTYYFGHHPANRFEFSRGRDLVLDPGPESGPINFLAYPVLEIDGQPARTKIEFSFKRH